MIPAFRAVSIEEITIKIVSFTANEFVELCPINRNAKITEAGSKRERKSTHSGGSADNVK